MDDSIFQCLEKVHTQYKERIESRIQSYTQACKSEIPSFLNSIRTAVTAESLEKHQGAVFLPIKKGCFSIFANTLIEQGVPVKVGITNGLDKCECECMLFMIMEGKVIATQSPFNAPCVKESIRKNNKE